MRAGMGSTSLRGSPRFWRRLVAPRGRSAPWLPEPGPGPSPGCALAWSRRARSPSRAERVGPAAAGVKFPVVSDDIRIRRMSAEPQSCFLGVAAIIVSPEMRHIMELVQRVARTSASVLITGETGCGKEIVARAIHHYSLRCSKPWVDINCGALPEQLMESELFGHERGAFSGAETARPGLFEMAHAGTLFLDEVGELEPRMQVKLLRVLDGVPYYRVG